MKIDSCSRIFSWPTYSARPRGRSARSMTSSCTPATLAVTTRLSSSFSIIAAIVYGLMLFARSFNACRMPSPTARPSGSCFTAATASLSL